MQLTLNKIRLENVKGLKLQEVDSEGGNVTITAENGVGKTTVLDGWLWLLFGKDSDGRADFNVRPLDADNQPIPGLVVAVESELLINGTIHTLRKEQREHIAKDGKVSYPKEYLIDGEPGILEKDFKGYIEAHLCPADKFRLLSALGYFNGSMKRDERRRTLVDVAGNIPDPVGFEGLLKNVNGRGLDAYKKIMQGRRAGYEKEKDEIGPRLDELQKGLDEYAQSHGNNEKELIASRDKLVAQVAGLDSDIKNLLATEKNRQQKAERINELLGKRLHRESVVKNQQGPLDELLDERRNLEQEHADKTQELVNLQNLIREANSAIDSAQNQIDSSLLTLKAVREEYNKANEATADETCYNCGQKLPADQIADAENKRQTAIAKIVARREPAMDAVVDCQARKEKLQDERAKLVATSNEKIEELKTAQAAKDKRIAEINEAIKTRPEVDPTTDADWQKLTKQTDKLKAELGEPVSEQLTKIGAKKGLADTQLHEINKALDSFVSNEKTKTRITEREARRKELVQLIADCERELDQIQQYKLAESKMVEASVNDKFQHVTWKLFDFYLNGDIDDRVCEAVYRENGVPYSDLSAGQKIFVDIDCINTLGDYYNVSVPMFIDHAESYTMPLETNAQTICLKAVVGIKELKIELLPEKRLQGVA